jgi:hypothetical protein
VTAHTPGPWVATANGIHKGTQCVALTHMDPREQRHADARLIAAAPDTTEALRGLLNLYVELVNSGDAGHWDAEKVPEVIAARYALAKAGVTP